MRHDVNTQLLNAWKWGDAIFCSVLFTFCVTPLVPQLKYFACFLPATVNNITQTGNPSTFCLCLSCIRGHWGLLDSFPVVLVWTQGYPGVIAWTSCQFIAVTKPPTLTTRDNLGLPISLKWMSLDCAGEPENLERTNKDTTKHCTNRGPGFVKKLGYSCSEATIPGTLWSNITWLEAILFFHPRL